MGKNPNRLVQHLHFAWHWHDEGAKMRRVWRSDWAGDQFEILDSKEFAEFVEAVTRFGFLVEEENDTVLREEGREFIRHGIHGRK